MMVGYLDPLPNSAEYFHARFLRMHPTRVQSCYVPVRVTVKQTCAGAAVCSCVVSILITCRRHVSAGVCAPQRGAR